MCLENNGKLTAVNKNNIT